ncbi:uncharacterized protein LOC127803658 [Diospyros lotus]|uniref:uncharacterized protein LOC127803658 n=1 Tax=Diospyros lotus TaxID=55363 RepID=UPI00225A937C|nr:uncharacterized protein LOC127803658 [Diospyros lotus]
MAFKTIKRWLESPVVPISMNLLSGKAERQGKQVTQSKDQDTADPRVGDIRSLAPTFLFGAGQCPPDLLSLQAASACSFVSRTLIKLFKHEQLESTSTTLFLINSI